VRKASHAACDRRLIVPGGIVGLARIMAWRTAFDLDLTLLRVAWPILLTEPLMAMFLAPVTRLAMASVGPDEQANAAGRCNVMHALASPLVQAGWSGRAYRGKPQRRYCSGGSKGRGVMPATLSRFATIIWIAPKPKVPIDISGGH
jgi:DHA2 family multidrug resistance protein